MPLTDLRDLQLQDMTALVAEAGEPAFRATQLCHWIYKRQATHLQQIERLARAIATAPAGAPVRE